MKTNTEKNNAKANNAKANNGTSSKKQVALDEMQKKVAKEEKAIKAAAFRAARLEKATERFNSLKAGRETKGTANVSLSQVHTGRANEVTIQGLITSTNALIKEVATYSQIDKQIIKVLKATAASVILEYVTEETLPLYIDNKGLYKTEAAYRLVCSSTKNKEVKQLLTNLKKQASK